MRLLIVDKRKYKKHMEERKQWKDEGEEKQETRRYFLPAGGGNDASARLRKRREPAKHGKHAPASQSSSSGGQTIDKSNLNAEGQTPLLKKKVSLTMLVVQDTNITDMKTNDYTKKLEEGVNVDLKFQYLPAGDDAKQKLSVMISSGSKLPDLVCGTLLSDIEAYTYGKQGYFLPLNDYADQISIYLKKYLQTDDAKPYLPYIYSADGKIYGMPRVVEDPGNEWSGRIWINNTWLKKLGLSMPKTTDDFENVLKAFHDKDPNGNGKQDEIPLVGYKGGWNSNVYDSLLGAFTYVNSGYDYMQVKDGKLQLSYMQPEWKKGWSGCTSSARKSCFPR